MKRESLPVKIFNNRNQNLESALLFEGLEEHNIADHENKWIPQLEAANNQAALDGYPPVAEDAHWRWSNKLNHSSGQIAYRHYAIEYRNYTVGLLMLKLVGMKSKIEPQKDLVYIDYISVCPEARKEITDPPMFKAIGSLLFQVAIEVSFEEGMQGRIGLHSLPKAVNWYQNKMRMKNLGPDISYQNLLYFELSSDVAAQLKLEHQD